MGMSRAKLGGNSSIQTLWQVGLLLLCPEELYPATPLLYFDVNRISAITKCPLYCNWHSQITTKVFIKHKKNYEEEIVSKETKLFEKK